MARGIILNHQFLVEVGLGNLERDQESAILDKLYRVLQVRVGKAMTNSLTKSERATFEQLIDEGNSGAAESYLERVVPDYAFVVRAELEFIASSLLQSIRQGGVLSDTEENPHG